MKEGFHQKVIEVIISKIGLMGETEVLTLSRGQVLTFFFWLWRAILIWVSPKFQVYVFSCLAFDHGLCGVFCALSLYAVSRSTKLFKWDLDATKIQLLVYNRVSLVLTLKYILKDALGKLKVTRF